MTSASQLMSQLYSFYASVFWWDSKNMDLGGSTIALKFTSRWAQRSDPCPLNDKQGVPAYFGLGEIAATEVLKKNDTWGPLSGAEKSLSKSATTVFLGKTEVRSKPLERM